MEGLVASVVGVEKTSSVSSQGNGSVTVVLKEKANVSAVRFEISSLLKQIAEKLPEGAGGLYLQGGNIGGGLRQNTRQVLSYIINADMDPANIKDYVERNKMCIRDRGNYNRSLVDVRDPETGRISYVANNTLSNDLSVYINQKIALTGGNVSLNTSLARLDQFSYDTKTYNSNPVTINYTQPLRSFNTLKWQKKTEPLQYEKAKKQYLESLEGITLQTTSYFFSVLSAQTSYRKSEENLRDTRGMYKIAQQRHDIGTVTKSELLQLERCV